MLMSNKLLEKTRFNLINYHMWRRERNNRKANSDSFIGMNKAYIYNLHTSGMDFEDSGDCSVTTSEKTEYDKKAVTPTDTLSPPSGGTWNVANESAWRRMHGRIMWITWYIGRLFSLMVKNTSVNEPATLTYGFTIRLAFAEVISHWLWEIDFPSMKSAPKLMAPSLRLMFNSFSLWVQDPVWMTHSWESNGKYVVSTSQETTKCKLGEHAALPSGSMETNPPWGRTSARWSVVPPRLKNKIWIWKMST